MIILGIILLICGFVFKIPTMLNQTKEPTWLPALSF